MVITIIIITTLNIKSMYVFRFKLQVLYLSKSPINGDALKEWQSYMAAKSRSLCRQANAHQQQLHVSIVKNIRCRTILNMPRQPGWLWT